MQHGLCSLKQRVNSDPKPFNFFNFWNDHPKFMQLVSIVWSQEIYVFPMFSLYQKLKFLKAELKENLTKNSLEVYRLECKRLEIEKNQYCCYAQVTQYCCNLRKRKTIALCH